ncbi:hypothetical protein PCL_06368 [Purpureocillium lilacinum]|uniref:Uncharacterized protein n=1 Tax=Purpureocillium lilacinum TaxID=33203 RepID=A0A2U3EMN6_PURLI|nr:hypothetical protein PCL_06368 [Purpureocillium lilacinum]
MPRGRRDHPYHPSSRGNHDDDGGDDTHTHTRQRALAMAMSAAENGGGAATTTADGWTGTQMNDEMHSYILTPRSVLPLGGRAADESQREREKSETGKNERPAKTQPCHSSLISATQQGAAQQYGVHDARLSRAPSPTARLGTSWPTPVKVMPPKLICPPPNGLPAGYRPAPPDLWPGRLLLPGAHGRHPRASQAPVGCPPPDASFFLLINSAAPIGKSVTMRGAAEGRASATAFLFFLQKQWELSPGTAARLIRIPARWAIRHIWRLPTRAWLRAYTTTSCQEDADSSTQSIGERCLLALHRPTTDPETKDIVQSMSEDGRSKPIAREGVRACMRADRQCKLRGRDKAGQSHQGRLRGDLRGAMRSADAPVAAAASASGGHVALRVRPSGSTPGRRRAYLAGCATLGAPGAPTYARHRRHRHTHTRTPGDGGPPPCGAGTPAAYDTIHP